ncbi:hypothetical protein CCMA1212_000215 [Trichoderma ghanense]|uniref:Uncharacterized protein n=1 Tax=Trichoderma ghanense TaxID=65468 RepID=A0ABY2HK04_9HYPO
MRSDAVMTLQMPYIYPRIIAVVDRHLSIYCESEARSGRRTEDWIHRASTGNNAHDRGMANLRCPQPGEMNECRPEAPKAAAGRDELFRCWGLL